MNFHKKCTDWNLELAKVNCYKTSFALLYAYRSFAAHA